MSQIRFQHCCEKAKDYLVNFENERQTLFCENEIKDKVSMRGAIKAVNLKTLQEIPI